MNRGYFAGCPWRVEGVLQVIPGELGLLYRLSINTDGFESVIGCPRRVGVFSGFPWRAGVFYKWSLEGEGVLQVPLSTWRLATGVGAGQGRAGQE